jgi:hypothetical protein
VFVCVYWIVKICGDVECHFQKSKVIFGGFQGNVLASSSHVLHTLKNYLPPREVFGSVSFFSSTFLFFG